MIKKLNYIFSKKEKIKIFILMVIVVIGSFLELLAVSIFSPFIDLIMNPESLAESRIMSFVYHAFSIEDASTFLALLAGGIILIYIIKNVYIILEKNAIYKFSYRIQRTISTRLLKAYMKEPYTFHLNNNISVLQRSMQEDTDHFTKGIIHIVEMLIGRGGVITEKKLWELNLPKEIIIGCILRGDQSLIPRGDTRVLAGDVLVIITSDQSKLEEIKELTTYEKV